MCEPVTVATVTGLGVGLGVVGAHASAQSGAKVQENNARMADYQRADVIQRGAYEARRIENEGRRVGESARVALGKGNVTGGVVDNALTAATVGAAQDASTVRANAMRAAWGLKVEAKDRRTQAKMTRQAGVLGALGQGLSGVGSVASAYGSFK